jgi:hypothetical protein
VTSDEQGRSEPKVITNQEVFACRVSGPGVSSGILPRVAALPLGRNVQSLACRCSGAPGKFGLAVVVDQFAVTARSRAQSRRAVTLSFIVTESG